MIINFIMTCCIYNDLVERRTYFTSYSNICRDGTGITIDSRKHQK